MLPSVKKTVLVPPTSFALFSLHSHLVGSAPSLTCSSLAEFSLTFALLVWILGDAEFALLLPSDMNLIKTKAEQDREARISLGVTWGGERRRASRSTWRKAALNQLVSLPHPLHNCSLSWACTPA
ncbi:hypothetical protein Q5P01_001384 [Channa striata]|uniref:Uncharacterized protein n=1 Tax=Channa striata TaxID=64152 RepID=A0AA88NQT2_CHASR|nr:hypothetical protein Q5P01_001384 [Channa striata]